MMVKKVLFYDFVIDYGKVEFKCKADEPNNNTIKDCHFYLGGDILPTNDDIASVLVTLVKHAFDEIHISLDVTKNVYDGLTKFSNSKIYVKNIVEAPKKTRTKRENIILSFSGGMDSLAALYIMPENTKLVAIDFEGGFSRERQFFERFNPYILKTNIRHCLKIDQYSWEFMGIGAMLYADYLNAEYNVFGSIYEASKNNLRKQPRIPYVSHRVSENLPFNLVGLKNMRYVAGITEVGTSIIVSHYAPDLIADSLVSLSNAGTEKRYRKEILMEIVSSKFKRNIKFEKTEPPKTKIKWGTNFALDFLCLYIMKNKGKQVAENTVSDIPNDAAQLVDVLSLDFYERLNMDFVNNNAFPNDQLRADMISKCVAAGVLPYTENDYEEYRIVADFLGKYHGLA